MEKKLTKGTDKKLCGVCSGIGDYFELDTTLVRILVTAATVLTGGTAILAYIIAAIAMPNKEG